MTEIKIHNEPSFDNDVFDIISSVALYLGLSKIIQCFAILHMTLFIILYMINY